MYCYPFDFEFVLFVLFGVLNKSLNFNTGVWVRIHFWNWFTFLISSNHWLSYSLFVYRNLAKTSRSSIYFSTELGGIFWLCWILDFPFYTMWYGSFICLDIKWICSNALDMGIGYFVQALQNILHISKTLRVPIPDTYTHPYRILISSPCNIASECRNVVRRRLY